MKANSYLRFITRRAQLVDWAVIFLTVAVGCVLVTLSYPLPNTGSDSFGYLDAAIKDKFSAYRPFGYSAYLQFLRFFSHSIYTVIVSHALIYALSAGLMLLAVKKYWPPRHHAVFIVFTVLAVFSPVAVFMLDTIYSDILFCSLIFIMLAMAMVFLMEESWVALVIYAVALFCSMHTRYSAMFFPLVFIPVFALKGKRAMRIASVGLTVAAFLVFYAGMCANMKDTYGKRQFSTGFDGWQLANNALHILPHLDKAELKARSSDEDVNALQDFCISYMDFIREQSRDGKSATAEFMWNNHSPLKQVLYYNLNKAGGTYYDTWIRLGSGVFRDYGKWLILKYPGKFIRYYLLPNMREMFFPVYYEMVCIYHDVDPGKKEIVEWFDATPDKGLYARNDNFGRVTRPLLPWIELITWIVLLVAVVSIFVRKGRLSRDTVVILVLIFLFGFIYYGTTTFASPIAMRYWVPMHAVKLCFAWIAFKDYKFPSQKRLTSVQ